MYVAKRKALISCMVTAQLICTLVLAFAKSRFSHDAAQYTEHCSIVSFPEDLLPSFKKDGYNDQSGLSQIFCTTTVQNEPRCEKTGLRGFRPGTTQPGCTVTEDGKRFEISYLGSRGIVLSV